MRARRVPQLVAGRRGGAVRWRRAAVVIMAAALPVTVIAAAAPPASAAGGYTVTATIAVGHIPSGVAVDPTTGNVYVTNEGDDTVSAIDEATDTVTATIAVGGEPIAVAVDPTTHTAYVTNETANTVSVISADGDPQPGSGAHFRAPAIRSANHAAFRPGKHASFTVRAVGLPVPSVTEAGKLPPGVRFTGGANGTAAMAGTPASSAKGKTYAITLTARDGAGHAVTRRFTLRVSIGR
jgi:YVTN family beta-propeller protein